MRTLATLLLLTMLCPCIANAQSLGKISGKILDKKNDPLEGATISAMNDETGIFIKHAVSNKKGEFSISGLPNIEKLLVIVSYTGYRDSSMHFDLSQTKKVFTIGDWKLTEGSADLEQVVVTARKPPFVVKKDTLEFNATAFKSLPNDMVQDLLRKLPGMLVDENGNLTYNGRKVTKVKVDGRDFFGSNMKTATQNLPSDIIDKVQVYETRERSDRFKSVIEPSGKELTLNLKLKKKNRLGIFGQASAGYGTEDRYNANAFINSFNEGRRVSLQGSYGNADMHNEMVGAVGFGRLAQGGGESNGIIKNKSRANFNLNDELAKGKLDFNYGFNGGERGSSTKTDRTNFLQDSSFLYNNIVSSNTVNRAHTFSFNYEKETDSLESLRIAPNFSFGNNISEGSSNSASSKTNGDVVNSQFNRNASSTRSFSFNNMLTYNRSSRNAKTNFTFSWNLSLNNQNGTQTNRNDNVFYTGNGLFKDSLDQFGNLKSRGLSNAFSFNFYQHITKRLVGIINYNYSRSDDVYDKDVFNFNSSSNKHDMLDSTYSIHNKNNNNSHTPSVSLGYKGERFSAELGAGFRFGMQENKIVWKDSVVRVDQGNFTPRLTLSYRLNKHSQITSNYTVNAAQPTAEQLAPVQDNTNPLYIKIGNPFLKTGLNHQFSTQLNYTTADFKWFASVTGSGAANTNQIVSDTYYDSAARQVSTYQNVSGAYSMNLMLSVGSMIRFNDLSLMFYVGPGINFNNEIGFINRQKNITKSLLFTPSASISLTDAKFTVSITAGGQSNSTRYSLAGIQDVQYNFKNLSLFTKWSPIKRLSITSMIHHDYNSQLPEEFQKSRTMWNGSIAYSFLKNQRLSAAIAVNDILNQNVSVSRTVSPTAIENTQVNALRRYGMLTLNYRLSKFGGRNAVFEAF